MVWDSTDSNSEGVVPGTYTPPPPSRRDAAGSMQACVDTRPTWMTILSVQMCGVSDRI